MKKYNFMLFPGFKDKVLTLSYDDGTEFDKRLIEILKKNKLKGTFNINSGLFGTAKFGRRRLTMEEVLDVYAQTENEIAVHGSTHISLAEVNQAVVANEVIQDKLKLEKMLGKIIYGMAYANGSCSERVSSIVKMCGIEYARTIISTERFDIPENWLMMPATCHHNNPRLMELAREFISNDQNENFRLRQPKMFCLWGHSFEFAGDNSWGIIEEFAEYMGNRKDVWYSTCGEIYNYVKAYERLKFSTDGKIVFNPNFQSVFLNYFDNKYEVKPGEQTMLESYDKK